MEEGSGSEIVVVIFGEESVDDVVLEERHEAHVGEDVQVAEVVPFVVAVVGEGHVRDVLGVDPGVEELEDLGRVGG